MTENKHWKSSKRGKNEPAWNCNLMNCTAFVAINRFIIPPERSVDFTPTKLRIAVLTFLQNKITSLITLNFFKIIISMLIP